MDTPATSSRRLPVVVLTLLALAVSPALAGVYKWTDAKGVVQFSDRPPAEGPADQFQLPLTNSSRGRIPAQATPGEPVAAKRQAKAKSVVMFSAEWCGYCRKARRYFQANRVAFRERDIDKDPAARREYERLGGRGLPLILVGDRRMSGFSEDGFRGLYDR